MWSYAADLWPQAHQNPLGSQANLLLSKMLIRNRVSCGLRSLERISGGVSRSLDLGKGSPMVIASESNLPLCLLLKSVSRTAWVSGDSHGSPWTQESGCTPRLDSSPVFNWNHTRKLGYKIHRACVNASLLSCANTFLWHRIIQIWDRKKMELYNLKHNNFTASTFF